MRPTRPHPLLCGSAASLFALALPASASAHGLSASTAESVRDYVWLGIRHMLQGWDHLLFMTGIVILAGGLARAAKLVSLFVLGHSLTLLVATLAGWSVDAAAVDAVIAASVAYVGIRILRGQPERWRWTALAIIGFGLAHGLGLSTRLQELPLPSGSALVTRILAFNVGVEIGQLAALSAIVCAGALFARFVGRLQLARSAGVAFVATGVVAAATLGAVAIRPNPSEARGWPGRCAEVDRIEAVDGTNGTHPDRSFYEPGEVPRDRDLQHVMLDGYIVVRYRADFPPEERNAIETWTENDSRGVVVVPSEDLTGIAFSATTAKRTLHCDALDLEQLSRFRAASLRQLRGGA